MEKKEADSSNCDYQSEIFREQLSELEYSRLLADSEEKELTNQHFISGGSGYGGPSSNSGAAGPSDQPFFLQMSGMESASEMEVSHKMNMVGNNARLKQVLISPVIANLESPLDGRAINPSSFRNSSKTKIL